MVNKIDSNFSSLRYAEEVIDVIGVLPGETDPKTRTAYGGQAEWIVLQPNSYSDFGGSPSLTVRNPITASRQTEKGTLTDLEVTAGFNIDFTENNMTDLLQGFLYASWRNMTEVTTVTAASNANTFTGNGLAVFPVGTLIVAEGFNNNEGVFQVTSSSATSLTVTPSLVAETAGPMAKLVRAGVTAAAGDMSIAVTANGPTLSSSTINFTTTGVLPGMWINIEGFTGANNNGYCRVSSISSNGRVLTLDKTMNTMTVSNGAGQTIRVWIMNLLRNEDDPASIIMRSYQFERGLSTAGYEYVKGAVPNELTLSIRQSDPLRADLTFMALDTDVEAVGDRKPGTFPPLSSSVQAYNAAKDFSRIRTAETDTLQTPLFGFIMEMDLGIRNNVTPLKALGTFGSFDVSIGDFAVEGSVTAYFSDVESVKAVRENEDITLDFVLYRNNSAWVFDLPLISFSDATLQIEKDEPIRLPVTMNASRSPTFGNTLTVGYFPYVPDP